MNTRIAITILCVLTLAACGGKESGLVVTDGEYRGGEEGMTGDPTGGMQFFLESMDALPMQAEATWSVPLRVRVLDSASRIPVSLQPVTFELLQSPGNTATLSALSSATNASGEATIDLRLGAMAGEATIRVNHGQALPLDIHVMIGEPTTGNVTVQFHDPGNSPVDLPPYRVAVYDQSLVSCASYVPRQRLPDVIAESHVPAVQNVTHSGLAPGINHTVIVEAVGSGAMTLASGCADGISVTPGQTVVADVRLDLVPINPSGTYDVESTWDLSEAVATQNGTAATAVRIIEFMADPGQAIYDIVLEEVEDAVGFGLDLLLDIAGVKDRMIDYINGQLNRSASAATFSAISSDLNTMLNELKVSSRLTVEKADTDFSFNGREEWTAVEVSWTWRCTDRNAAGCESQVVDLTGTGAQAGAVSYDWTGQVDNYSDLRIDSHEAQIDIGRLQLYLLEQVILPDLTNGQANSIGEAVAYWIDCDALANAALNGSEICDPTGIFCAGPPEAAVACEFALTQLGDYLAEPLQEIDVKLDIQLAGTATLVDGDANSVTDQIDDGATTGALAGSTEPVTVQWSAVTAN